METERGDEEKRKSQKRGSKRLGERWSREKTNVVRSSETDKK